MQAYSFDELEERAKVAAIKRYAPQGWLEASYLANAKQRFSSWGWRFTEHGERIA